MTYRVYWILILAMSLLLLFFVGCEEPQVDTNSKILFNQEISNEEKFNVEKDFSVNNNVLLDLSPEDIKELLGEPPEQISEDKDFYTDMLDYNDRLMYEYEGFIIDFVGDIKEESFSFNYLKITDDDVKGPRGIKVGQDYEKVVGYFKNENVNNYIFYEGEQIANERIRGQAYLDENKDYIEQVIYVDIYENEKASIVLNFNEQENVEEIFLSKDLTW